MRMPRVTAEQALGGRSACFQFAGTSRAGGVVPAIPFCRNCDDILDRCAENGFKPRAVCRACLYGDCYSGEEKPPIVLQGGRPVPFF
jgi:hypothetical protein